MPEATVSIVSAIGISVVTAATLAFLFKRLRLPELLAYIVAGLVLGLVAEPILGEAIHQMEVVSHLGLVFLLFIIGLEMDIRGVFKLGPRVAAAVILQAPIAIVVVVGVQWLASQAGVSIPGLGSTESSWLFFGVACALGSTAVVVKLLDDRFDLNSQAGRLTVLTLIAEDLVAVAALSYVQVSGGGEDVNSWLMLGGGVTAIVAFVLFSRFVLSRVMASLARSPDMIALVSLGWCFLCAETLYQVGLSAEMGALVAGLTLAQLPQRVEVLAKVLSLRDFFLALFFVALGLLLPAPTIAILLEASALVAIVWVARLVLFTPTLLFARQGPVVSFAAPINLAQVSEFSLLLIPVGVSQGQLSVDDATTISYALMISVVITSFTIPNNYRISLFMSRLLRLDVAQNALAGDDESQGEDAEIVLLGFFRNAESLVRRLREENSELLGRMLVIDFNLNNHPRIRAHGLRVAYGDISNPETLRHFCIGNARVVVSTISDTFLRGTSNAELAESLRILNPKARFIATAVDSDDSVRLSQFGAHDVVCPPNQTAPAYIQAIMAGLAGTDEEDDVVADKQPILDGESPSTA